MVKTTGNVNVFPQLKNGMKFKRNEMNRIRYYFINEIRK